MIIIITDCFISHRFPHVRIRITFKRYSPISINLCSLLATIKHTPRFLLLKYSLGFTSLSISRFDLHVYQLPLVSSVSLSMRWFHISGFTLLFQQSVCRRHMHAQISNQTFEPLSLWFPSDVWHHHHVLSSFSSFSSSKLS